MKQKVVLEEIVTEQYGINPEICLSGEKADASETSYKIDHQDVSKEEYKKEMRRACLKTSSYTSETGRIFHGGVSELEPTINIRTKTTVKYFPLPFFR